jgi:hypothetical protein
LDSVYVCLHREVSCSDITPGKEEDKTVIEQ